MGFPGNRFLKICRVWLAFVLGLLSLPSAWSQDVSLESAGARFGFSAHKRSAGFKQAEAFVDWNLPWSYFLFDRWHLQWRLDATAGWLGRDGEDAAIFSSGPSLILRRDHIPLALEFGTIPTVITRDSFGAKNLGSYMQFTTYGGIDFNLGSHTRLGYRYQHMSNAGIDGHNPGLNLHAFQVSWRF